MKSILATTLMRIASGSCVLFASTSQAFELTGGVDVNIFIAQHAQSAKADGGAIPAHQSESIVTLGAR